jgi:hypothetical protein
MIDGHSRLDACLRDLMKRRPFEGYVDQPDTAERTRLAVQSIPLALPEKRAKTRELVIDEVSDHL